MAEVAMAGGDASGFKLFGTMILVVANQTKVDEGEEDEERGVKDDGGDVPEAAAAAAARGVVALACPRCKSKETKFCYFNNYNVNQPRHFCRACHRYWTAGGTLRNVPVGAGRRKARPAPRSGGIGGSSYVVGYSSAHADGMASDRCLLRHHSSAERLDGGFSGGYGDF